MSAGNISRLAELVYIPKETEYDVRSILIECAEKFYHEIPEVLHLLHALGMQTEEANLIEKYVNSLETIEQKLKILKQLNEGSGILFKTKCLSDDRVNTLILDSDKIISEITDVSSAERILNRYVSVDAVRNRDSTVEALLRILMRNIKESHNLSDVFSFWKQIEAIGKRYVKFVNQEKLYNNLYSDAVLNALISKFPDEDLYEIAEYTPIEKLLREMRNLTDRTQEILELPLVEEISEARWIQTVLLHRS